MVGPRLWPSTGTPDALGAEAEGDADVGGTLAGAVAVAGAVGETGTVDTELTGDAGWLAGGAAVLLAAEHPLTSAAPAIDAITARRLTP